MLIIINGMKNIYHAIKLNIVIFCSINIGFTVRENIKKIKMAAPGR